MKDVRLEREVKKSQIPEYLQEYPPEQYQNLSNIMKVMEKLQKTKQG